MATKFVAPFALSRRHTLGFYAPIAANLIATYSCWHTWRFFLPIATMWHFIPGSIGWRLKNFANQYKQTEWRQRSEKIVGCCHNFAPKALQEAFLKVGQWKSMVKDMDLLKRSLSWDDYRSRSTLHQIGMAFLTTLWSNLPLFLRFRNNFRCIPPFWKIMW